MHADLNPATGVRIDLMGPTVEFLNSPKEANDHFCVLRGVIPAGGSVPLHSHADTEDFFVVSGEIEAVRQVEGEYVWAAGKAGDYFHVPGGARHGWRNVSSEPLVVLIITTPRLGQFFLEAGRPVAEAAQPATSKDLARLSSAAAKFGYWHASQEENLAIGIYL
jgi:quercetin dioxygenase-like cupin family protein